jgi:hypothetical protein
MGLKESKYRSEETHVKYLHFCLLRLDIRMFFGSQFPIAAAFPPA